MLNFNEFLTEEDTGKANQQKHLPHVAAHAFYGHEGVGLTDSMLRGLHNYLLGAKRNVPKRVEKKVDGAPAFHVGIDDQGRKFVASKSLYNKNPKINYTEEDIQRNHGHAPGLVAALTQVLNNAHKVLPNDMKPGEIYKGDFLFGGEGKSLQDDGEHVTSQPNLLNYKWPKGSPEAQKAQNAKVGVAFHTFFDKKGNAQPISEQQRGKFVDHPDVFNYDPTAEINPQNYTPEEQRAFEMHMENARKSYSRTPPEVYDKLTGHGELLDAFSNSRVRSGNNGTGTVEDYLNFLNARANKDVASVKTQAAKDKKTQQHAALMNQVTANAKHFKHILEMHSHFQNAKDVLLGVLAKNSKETIEMPNGQPTGHEGYVITDKAGHQVKAVSQKPPTPEEPAGSFAFNNLNSGGAIAQQIAASRKQQVQESLGATTSSKHYPIHSAFRRSVHIEPRAGSKQIPVRSSVAASRSQHQQYAAITKNKIRVREEIEITEAQTKKLVMNFGRMSPIHEGHGEVIRTVVNTAQRLGADHKIIMSHTQDAKKNPLTAAQKLKHARRAFPGVNFDVSSPAQPSLLHHLAKAHADGYKEVTIVGGSDRDAMGQMAQRYNGVKGAHGFYDVKLNFVQAGANRDEGSGSGVASYSASKMRDAASKNDFNSFKSMAPKTMKEPHVRDMFNDTRSGMKITESVSFKGFIEFLQEGSNYGKDHYAALDDVHVNLENRNHAFEEYGYGPLNPKEPNEDFWKQKAKLFKTTVTEAKKSLCGNCAAFNQSKKIMKRITDGLGPAGEKVNEKANLGFCEMFKFKCAAERTCDAWLVNGPITETYTSAVRGLGYVTGEPSAPQGDVQQYFNNNAQQVNQINDSLSKQIVDNELSGAKAFNPKEVKNGRVSFKYWETDDNGNPFMIDLVRKRQR